MSDGKPRLTYELVEKPPVPWWRRRVVVALAALAVLTAAVWVTVSVAGREEEVPLTAPRAGRDTVPAEKVVKRAPERCGVSEATARSLIGERDFSRYAATDSCMWSHRTGDGETRILEVDFTFDKNAGQAMAQFSRSGWILDKPAGRMVAERESHRTVTGLGDEAVFFPFPIRGLDNADGATMKFRFGNALIDVIYQRWRTGLSKPRGKPSEKEVNDGVFKAAAEAAKALGAPASPSLSARPVPFTALQGADGRHPCSLISAERLRTLVPHPSEPNGKGLPWVFEDVAGLVPRHCSWSTSMATEGEFTEGSLAVTVAFFPDLGGLGQGLAAREYTKLHLLGRAAPGGGPNPGPPFQALAGPWDQAFRSGHLKSVDGDAVVFRKRNTVVAVRYEIPSDASPDGAKIVDRRVRGAYTAALEVAERLNA